MASTTKTAPRWIGGPRRALSLPQLVRIAVADLPGGDVPPLAFYGAGVENELPAGVVAWRCGYWPWYFGRPGVRPHWRDIVALSAGAAVVELQKIEAGFRCTRIELFELERRRP